VDTNRIGNDWPSTASIAVDRRGGFRGIATVGEERLVALDLAPLMDD
jgi:hypothetical protein